MAKQVEVLRLGVPHDTANHEKRIEQALTLLGEIPTQTKVFVPGEEINGVIPVTIAGWLDHRRIAVSEMAVAAKSWDPVRFAQELNQARVS